MNEKKEEAKQKFYIVGDGKGEKVSEEVFKKEMEKELRSKNCNICGKKNLTEFNENRFVLRKTTPDILKRHLFQQGKNYNSYFYLCYNCSSGFLGKNQDKFFKRQIYKGSNTRMKLLLKKKSYLTKHDFIYFKGGDIRTRDYWFTLKIQVYGYITIYDKKGRKPIMELSEDMTLFEVKLYKEFLGSKIEKIWEIIED